MSFVGKSYAKVGFRFYFQGINPNCPKKCSLYATCQTNLTPNSVYEITEVLNRDMECPKDFHKESMILVKLNKPNLWVSMHNKDIYEGSIVNFIPISCQNEDCGFIEYCEPHKLLLQKTQRVKVLKIIKKISECIRGFHLSIVKLEIKDK